MKFSKFTINFCGQERKFKRCPTSKLKEYQKEMEELQKKVQPDLEVINKAREDLENIIEDHTIIKDRIDILKGNKDNGLDKDTIEQIFSLQDEAKKLRKTIRKKEKALENQTKEMIDKQEKNNDLIIDTYDQLCINLIEPFEPGEFKENYDMLDQAKAAHLGTLYTLYMSNKPEKEIQKQVNEIIDNQLRQFEEISSFQR